MCISEQLYGFCLVHFTMGLNFREKRKPSGLVLDGFLGIGQEII